MNDGGNMMGDIMVLYGITTYNRWYDVELLLLYPHHIVILSNYQAASVLQSQGFLPLRCAQLASIDANRSITWSQ